MYANKRNTLSLKLGRSVTCRDWELEKRFRRVKSFAAFRLMSLKRICEAGNEYGSWIQQRRGVSRVAKGLGGGWIGSLAEHWQCKHARLNRLRTCADAVSDLKWFAVTACTWRVGTKRELRAFTYDAEGTRLFGIGLCHSTTRWAEYRASLSVDLLKADWNWSEGGKFDFRDFGRFPRSSEWCGDLNYSATNESYFPGTTILCGFSQAYPNIFLIDLGNDKIFCKGIIATRFDYLRERKNICICIMFFSLIVKNRIYII